MPTAPIPHETLLAHREWVRSVARAVVRDPNSADDVEQETWLVALRTPPRHEGSLRGWFGAVARSRARRIGRSDSRRDARETAAARAEATSSAAELAELADTHRRVVQAVVELDEPYRETILLRYFEGLAIDAVAARTGAPLETTRSRLKRGVAKLRERLERELGTKERPWHLALVPLIGGSKETAAGTAIGAAAGGGVVMATKTAYILGGALVLGGVGAVVATKWSVSADEPAVVAKAPAPPAAAPVPPPRPAPAQDDPKPKPPEPQPPAPKPEPAAPEPSETASQRLARVKLKIDWRETPLLEVFGELAERTGVDIVVSAEAAEAWGTHEDAELEMLRLDQEVRGQDVLNLVTQLKGLAYVIEEPHVVIVPAGVTRDPSKPVVVPPKPSAALPLAVLGRVTDPQGVSVAGAEIVRDGRVVGTTDGAGRFDVKLAKPYGSIEARAPRQARSYAVTVTGEPGAQVTIDLFLRGAAGSVVVRVSSDDGPVADAVVTVGPETDEQSTRPDGRKAVLKSPWLQTDAKGTVTIDGVPVGAAPVAVRLKGYETATSTATVEAGKFADVTIRLVKGSRVEGLLASTRISFSFQGASFAEVVKFINDAKQLSIVIDPALAPTLENTTITLDLSDVSVATALRTLCKLAGDVEYVTEGPIVFIRAVKR